MVPSSQLEWLETYLRARVARFFPSAEAVAVQSRPSLRDTLTARQLTSDERRALEEWREGNQAGRSVQDLIPGWNIELEIEDEHAQFCPRGPS